MRLVLFVMTFLVFGASVSFVQAREEGIAAVVNADVISMSDVFDRMKLIIVSSGLPDSSEIRKNIAPQVLSSLMEEQIKLQEARRLGLEITPAEIDQGFATIAQQNNFPPEKFKGMLQQGGINISTMRHQIESQIAWTKVVQSQLRPRVSVTESDIDSVLARLNSSVGANEYLLAEIYLPVDEDSDEKEVRQLAQKLTQQIKMQQAPFYKLAQQFSKAAGAPQGGNMGWMQEAHLPEEIAEVVRGMDTDNVSAPVRSKTGYHILYLREKRQVSAENIPSRDEIMSKIGTERLDREQRRYFLDLKSSAFIENRIDAG